MTGTPYRFARNSIKTLSFRKWPFPRLRPNLSDSLRNRSGVMERHLSVEPNPTFPIYPARAESVLFRSAPFLVQDVIR